MASIARDGTVVALQAMGEDLYWPRNTGVFNVVAAPLSAGMKNQRWRYDSKLKSIVSHTYPEKVLSEGANKNLFLFDQLGLGIQKFLFDTTNGILSNILSRNVATLSPKKANRGWNVDTKKLEWNPQSLYQHWVMLDCTAIKGYDQIETDHTGHNHAHSQLDSNDDDEAAKVSQALNEMMKNQPDEDDEE